MPNFFQGLPFLTTLPVVATATGASFKGDKAGYVTIGTMGGARFGRGWGKGVMALVLDGDADAALAFSSLAYSALSDASWASMRSILRFK